MKATDFAPWLQGAFELGNVKSFDEKQTATIRNHLAMVFLHDIDPSAGNAEHQAKLSKLHTNNNPVNIHSGVNFPGPTVRC